MKRSKSITIIFIVLFVVAVSYTLWIISRPAPIELQGQMEVTQVKVSSKLTGRIDSIYIHRGDWVEKGDTLYRISSPEIDAKLNQAEAARSAAAAQNQKAKNGAQEEDVEAAYKTYLKANAAAEFAKKTNERITNLFQSGVVTAQQKDEADMKLKIAEETTAAAKAIWEKAKKGARVEDKNAAMALVDRADAVISELNAYKSEACILAPRSGEVANLLAETGELVPAGFPVVILADLNDQWLTINIREDMLSAIRKGDNIDVTVPALGLSTIPMTVSYIQVMGDFATWKATKTTGDFDMKTFEVHAVPTQKVDGLRPGMSGLVNLNNLQSN